MSQSGSWPTGAEPGPYAVGPYQPAGQPPPVATPPSPSPWPAPPSAYPGGPPTGVQDQPSEPSEPQAGAFVAACMALGLALLIGLSRWVAVYLNTTDAEFREWPYRTAPAMVELVLALAGFVHAVLYLRPARRRTTASWALLAAGGGVLGYAVNDGLYQLLSIIV